MVKILQVSEFVCEDPIQIVSDRATSFQNGGLVEKFEGLEKGVILPAWVSVKVGSLFAHAFFV